MVKKYDPLKKRVKIMTFIIYPDNALQMDFFAYCCMRERIIYILHNSDKKIKALGTEGSPEQQDDLGHDFKKHYHVMIMFDNQRTVQSFIKSSCGALSYAQPVSDRVSMLRYFIHDTYACYRDGKERYTLDDLKTNCESFLASCIFNDQVLSNTSCVSQLLNILDAGNFMSYRDFIGFLVDNSMSELLAFVTSHSHFVLQMYNNAIPKSE